MEHYDIEDSFKRIVVPSLQVQVHLLNGGRRSGPEGEFATVLASLILLNKSQVSGRYPYLIVVGTTGIKALDKIHRGPRLPAGFFTGVSDDIIHPELSVHAVDLQREFRMRGEYLPRGTLDPPMEIRFRHGCLDSRPNTGTCQITDEQVAQALNISIV